MQYIYLSQTSMKDVQATGEASSPQKRASITSKLNIFFFCCGFFPPPGSGSISMRIRIYSTALWLYNCYGSGCGSAFPMRSGSSKANKMGYPRESGSETLLVTRQTNLKEPETIWLVPEAVLRIRTRCLFDPRIRDGKKVRVQIRDEQPGSYFREHRHHFLNSLMRNQDGKNRIRDGKIRIRDVFPGSNTDLEYRCRCKWRAGEN